MTRKKNLNFGKIILFLVFLCVIPVSRLLACGSGLSILSVTLSPSTAALGSSISVTVVYQQTAGWNQVYLLGGFNLNQNTFQGCNTTGQDFVIYQGAPGNGDSPGAGSDAGGYLVNPGGTGPATQVFTVTVPPELTPGVTYNFIVGGSGCDAKCGDAGNMESQSSASLTTLLPPPSCAATVLTEGVTAAPNGFFLFDIDYSFVNAGSSNIVYPLPSNVTYVSAGPNAVYNGGSNSVSWNLGNVSSPQTGVLWTLVSVNSGTGTGVVIPNVATLNSANCGTSSSNTANAMVQIPNLTLTKSQSAASLSAGSTITYNLDWTSMGQNLQFYDSYDNIPQGSNTNGSAVAWGYDLTNYTVASAGSPSANGTWTVETDALGNHYIDATVASQCGGGAPNQNPELIRNIPGVDICGNFIVEGDIEVPNSTSCPAGADAHMVLACNPSQGITLKAAISIDNNPGNLFIQKNNIYPLPAGASMGVTFPSGSPTTIVIGNWYTLRVQVQCSGTGTITYTAALWPKGDPAAAVTLNYTDNTPIQPICSGGWTQGWQVDETSGEDWYSNLKVFGPGPILSAAVTDVVPAGVTYIGSTAFGIYNGGTNTISWSSPNAFPVTMFSFDTPINWWGTVACPGPITNNFTMAANSIPAVTSNTVTLSISGGCITTTPTPSPTATPPIVSSFGCFALSGDGGDTIISNVGGYVGTAPAPAVVVTDVTLASPMNWPSACGGQWISDNANAFALQSTPATMVFQRTFSISSAIISSGSFGISFGADDTAYYVLSNSLYPSGVTIASTLFKNCQGQAFSGSLLSSSGPNTLTSYLINTTSIPTGVGSNYGFTGLYYALCVMGLTPTPTATPTLTPTSTITATPTLTITPTITNTSSLTPTSIPTPVGLHVWPNPFNPQYAWPGNGVGYLRAYMVPPGTKMKIYSISGELVITLGEDPAYPGYIDWDAKNNKGVPVSAGIYYYVIQNNNSTLLSGKVLILRD